jgi:hypothetical protein
MSGRPALVVFLGGFGTSPVEHLVDDARTAASLDAIDAWLATGIGLAVLATDQSPSHMREASSAHPEGTRRMSGALTLDVDDGPFHFGHRLSEVIRKNKFDSVVYIGGGSVPLFTTDDFRQVASRLDEGLAVTNNLFSSDLIAFPVTTEGLPVVERVARDNSLARALHDAGAAAFEALPRTVATQFDIDTPVDVAILRLTSQGGPRLARYLAEQKIDVSRYEAVLPLFLDQTKQIVVAGRVGSHAWSYLERQTACRVRVFAEERGMEADGRADSGAAGSLLGYYLDEVGVDRFFQTLAELGDAAFIDTRVLLAHEHINASREYRFLSDLGTPDDIRDPFLRDFTRAALEAPIPVLLGGHSLMSGGLMALNEHAWSLRDAGKL